MRVNKISKQTLVEYLNRGLTTRQVAQIEGVNHSYVSYLATKYGITELYKYKKPTIDQEYFSKIDTKEKAYITGFLLADGCVTKGSLSVSVALHDREVLDFISSEVGFNVREYRKLDRSRRLFPSAVSSCKLNSVVRDLVTLFGGEYKEDRHVPIVRKDLDMYLLLGIFDADGCITWGRRKDRGRVWQKVSFTSSLKILTGVQSLLYKRGIPTRIYPKKGSNCYVMDIGSKEAVLKFIDFIYSDLVVLNRKYNNANALRLELGELGETLKGNTEPH